jgi:hypothetical protein
LPGILPSRTVDLSDEDSVKRLFSQTGSFDHLVVAGSSVETGPFRELSLADARASVDSKFWGQYGAARYAQIRPKGSIITLFSGILSRGPAAGQASLAAINAGVVDVRAGSCRRSCPHSGQRGFAWPEGDARVCGNAR